MVTTWPVPVLISTMFYVMDKSNIHNNWACQLNINCHYNFRSLLISICNVSSCSRHCIVVAGYVGQQAGGAGTV